MWVRGKLVMQLVCVYVLILVGWGAFRNLFYIEQQTDAKQCVHHAKTETEENLKL